jgi:hypothetical protein
MAPMFRRSNACVHDFTYWQGGDEKRRKECDDGFMLRLVQDALDASIWTRGYYLILAVVFYASVRILGKRHFNYR